MGALVNPKLFESFKRQTDDWFEFNFGNKNWLREIPQDFNGAKKKCEDLGGHLAIVKTNAAINWAKYQIGYNEDNGGAMDRRLFVGARAQKVGSTGISIKWIDGTADYPGLQLYYPRYMV